MNELLARNAGQFTPKTADDFIGDNIIERQSGTLTGARAIARHIDKLVRLARKNGNTPIKLLFNGVPASARANCPSMSSSSPVAIPSGAPPSSTAHS